MDVRFKRLAIVIVFAGAISAHTALSAAAQRTFVASSGNDTSPCSITQPCRSFVAAAAKTDPGGELIVLDSAGYGAVTLTKSISIIAPPGVYAGISVFGGDGITIDDGGSFGQEFTLRGLTINGQGGALVTTGIDILNAVAVDIESCIITNMSTGIFNQGASAQVRVAGSTVRSNLVGGEFHGGTLRIENSEFDRNSFDGMLLFAPTALATIRGSRFTRNSGFGLSVVVGPSSPSFMTVAASQSEFSANGNSGIHVYLSASSIGNLNFDSISVHANGRSASAPGVQIGSAESSTVSVSISGSGITSNSSNGIYVGGLGDALITVADSAINDNNQPGVHADSAGVIVGLNHNTIARNATSDIQQVAPAVVRTFQNNALTGSGAGDVSGALVAVTTK